jgi:hypothetical protein
VSDFPLYVSHDPELSAKLLFGNGLSDLNIVHRLSTALEHLDNRITPNASAQRRVERVRRSRELDPRALP